jgi:hypothetical protein
MSVTSAGAHVAPHRAKWLPWRPAKSPELHGAGAGDEGERDLGRAAAAIAMRAMGVVVRKRTRSLF